MRLQKLLPLLLFVGLSARGQVTLQTGAPDIHIPLFQYKDDASKLKLDISLGYTGGNGIRVDEKASEVGLGWTLNTGGLVQRMVVGEPDDQRQRQLANNEVIPAGIFFQPDKVDPPYALVEPNPFKLAWIPSYNTYGKVYYDRAVHFDREHDKFVFSLNGDGGCFILGKNYPHNAIEEELSSKKIEIIYGQLAYNAGMIQGFVITDDDGIKYTYTNKVLDAVMINRKGCLPAYLENFGWLYGCFPQGAPPINDYVRDISYHGNDKKARVRLFTPVETGYKIANAWYISKIENPLTGSKIQFNYITRYYTENLGIEASRAVTAVPGYINGGPPTLISNITVNEKVIKTEYPQLISIDFPEGKKITFSYFTDRKDELGKAQLDEISYTSNNQLQYKYIFNHGYFYQSSIVEANSLPSNYNNKEVALSLNSITKLGSDGVSEPATKFEYYTGQSGSNVLKFPERNAYNQDHWGYYNGTNYSIREAATNKISWAAIENYVQNIAANKAATSNTDIVKIGLLKSIYDKFGGKTTYQYSVKTNATGPIGGVIAYNIVKSIDELNYESKSYLYSLPDFTETPVYNSSYELVNWLPENSRYKSYSFSTPHSVGATDVKKMIDNYKKASSKVSTTNDKVKSSSPGKTIVKFLMTIRN
jgi:hypothetical protein